MNSSRAYSAVVRNERIKLSAKGLGGGGLLLLIPAVLPVFLGHGLVWSVLAWIIAAAACIAGAFWLLGFLTDEDTAMEMDGSMPGTLRSETRGDSDAAQQ